MTRKVFPGRVEMNLICMLKLKSICTIKNFFSTTEFVYLFLVTKDREIRKERHLFWISRPHSDGYLMSRLGRVQIKQVLFPETITAQ